VFRENVYTSDAFRYWEFSSAVSAEEYDEYVRAIRSMSLYDTGVTAAYGDKLLTLSTCDGRERRLVVVGVWHK
jgi:sortase B